jgi:hypothetical protein
MSRKNIFLVGAPSSASLDWDSDELLNTPIPPFFDESTETPGHQPSLDQSLVKWRVLRAPTDLLSASFQGHDDPAFFISHQLAVPTSKENVQDSILSRFYDHSFTIYEKNVSSDVSTPESSLEDSEMTISSDKDVKSTRMLHITGPLSDLQNLPTARYLHSIAPQTMTVNLIVGILAVHPPRRVVTRQWKTELDIFELVVGDETRAGFAVNFWIKPDKSAKNSETDLGRSLASLRPHDIVLFRTVGLSTFQDRVYGQSLRKLTTVELLHRKPVDVTDAVGFYQGRIQGGDQPLLKVRRVRNWMLRFVTDPAGGETHTRGLPPDTQ